MGINECAKFAVVVWLPWVCSVAADDFFVFFLEVWLWSELARAAAEASWACLWLLLTEPVVDRGDSEEDSERCSDCSALFIGGTAVLDAGRWGLSCAICTLSAIIAPVCELERGCLGRERKVGNSVADSSSEWVDSSNEGVESVEV